MGGWIKYFSQASIIHAKAASQTFPTTQILGISEEINLFCSIISSIVSMEMTRTPSSEDVIQGLLDYFVEPFLPVKSFHESPSLDQQLSLAKQVRAVVILYNYYQRKLQPQLEFLDLESFCKLVVVLKPSLLPFMKHMQQSDVSKLVDVENQLSPTEETIMDACHLCGILDASKCIPGTEGWPITKVSVLVIDSSMENCLLLRSTATRGAWSVIEKDLGVSNISSEGTAEAKYTNRKKGSQMQTQTCDQSVDAFVLQQVALSAVMEVAGIDQNNIKVLENHVIYSLSEEAGAACFYVMQCTQTTSEGFLVPIKDVVDRLQRPLLKMTLNGWMVSPAAEYFHLFPYAGILSDFISRTLLVNRIDVSQPTSSPIGVDALNHGEINRPLHLSKNHKDKNQSLENLVEVNQQMINASSEGSKDVWTVVTKSESVNFSSSEREEKGSKMEAAENEKVVSNGLHSFRDEFRNVNVNSSQGSEKPCDGEVQENRGSINQNFTSANFYCKEPTGADSSNRKNKEFDDKEKPNKFCDIKISDVKSLSHADSETLEMASAEELQISPNLFIKRQKKDVDGLFIPSSASGSKNKFDVLTKVDPSQKRKISVEVVASSPEAVARCNIATSNALKLAGSKHNDADVSGICIQGSILSSLNQNTAADSEHFPCETNSEEVEKLQNLLVRKGTLISETALRVLSHKIERMCHQQRVLEDKIAICSRDIQKIIDGDEDAFALRIQAIIDFCNDSCLEGENEIQGETQRTIHCSGRDGLSDTILTFESPCQELDYICHVNNWRLPRYLVTTSSGKFVANVTMEETDFEFKGALLSTPSAARDSAAALMIAKLHETAGQT